jgi:hypothetical protein
MPSELVLSLCLFVRIMASENRWIRVRVNVALALQAVVRRAIPTFNVAEDSNVMDRNPSTTTPIVVTCDF